MTSIRKAKKLGIYKVPKRTKESKQLYNETRELISQVNKRLKGLENNGLKGTWASRKLFDRLKSKILGVVNKKGKIKINKRMTNTQLIGVRKASQQFLESKTSTLKGIKSVKESTLESLKTSLSKDLQMSNVDVEAAYEMLSNKDFDYFNEEDKIGASTMWVMIEDAIEYNYSEKTFVKQLQNIWDFSNDQDAIEKAKRLYDKYVL